LVHVEIAAALNRGILIVPVLVEHATMPSEEELPPPLAGLARRNAMELTDVRWDYDVSNLVGVLAEVVKSPTMEQGRRRALAAPRRRQTRRLLVAGGVSLLVVVTVALIALRSGGGGRTAGPDSAGSEPQRFTVSVGEEVRPGRPEGAGNIERPGAVDIYTFRGSAEQSVFFDVLGECGPPWLRWTLESAEGDPVFANETLSAAGLCHDVGPVRLPSTGDYELRAFGDGDATGAYRFRLSAS
jgi:hypothetical protein